MREIKFKTWDVIIKKMFKSFSLYEYVQGHLDYDKEVETHPIFPKGVIFLQFTGLKDKNGKEIYEGDIVKDTLSILNVVKFDNGEFYFIIDEENSLKLAKLLDEGSKLRVYEPDEWKWYDCELIGNIYENPELLNKSFLKREEGVTK